MSKDNKTCQTQRGLIILQNNKKRLSESVGRSEITDSLDFLDSSDCPDKFRLP